MRVYYNEIDKKKCAALQALMEDGHISTGDIDDRSITEVTANDLKGYTRAHFFAGGGGWDAALNYAGWTNRPVWTASPPCQGYSQVGEQKGYEDERDLCPVWCRLLTDYADNHGMPVCFGEQVAEAIEFGWLDRLFTDMGATNYAVWPVVLPSAAAGTFDKRVRLFFMAYPDTPGLERHAGHVREVIKGALAGGYATETGLCDPPGFIADWRGVKRPIEPGVPLLVDGLPERVVQLLIELFGDAINVKLAAEFIQSAEEALT